ncbi:hypothetical protein [Embleya sp. MST-111070]|uniref:hypothetical protein n=1 Tax=Embleya sp. MST-111070 TaxID=3398231 RepID=UPI003F73BFDB
MEVGEHIVGTEVLYGGLTAEMRKLTVGTRSGTTRHLVLRTFVDVEHAEDWLDREAGALSLFPGTGVPAPGLVAVDPTAARRFPPGHSPSRSAPARRASASYWSADKRSSGRSTLSLTGREVPAAHIGRTCGHPLPFNLTADI